MTITRVTQQMMSRQSLAGLQSNLTRLAELQEQMTTGRRINRPSDSPIEATSAMRLRASRTEAQQFARNSQDGLGWLGQLDTSLQTMSNSLRQARDLALTGANGVGGQAALDALATEVEQIRSGLISTANATYLDRPVFGGITAGSTAYDASGTYVGTTASVDRSIAPGVNISVNIDAETVLGPAGSSVFDELTDLANALRAGDMPAVRSSIDNLNAAGNRVTAALADVGTRYKRVEDAGLKAQDSILSLSSQLSEVENVDLAQIALDVKMQEVAYQGALAATARVLQPTLMDFLR